MFGPRKGNEGEIKESSSSHESTPRSSAAPNLAQRARTADVPVGRRNDNSSAERKLTVGKGLSLAGEITSCDILVVEGKVEAKLTDGKLLEITESGQFRGSVEIENADIAGRYDGQLIVHGRLTIRSTGRVSGMVKYGELEISAGGQIIGELQVAGANAPQAAGNTGFKSAAKFTAAMDEDDQAERKSA